MKKIDAVVLHETTYIAIWTVIFSLAMEAVFLIGGWFDYTVPLGNILGVTAAVLNFFLMGLSLQKALEKDRKVNDYRKSDLSDEGEETHQSVHTEAKQIMKLSHTLRNMMLLVFCVVGVMLPCFNPAAVLVPMLFPRIAIMLRPMFMKSRLLKGGEEQINEQ